jgi:hypothetical protein
MTNTFNDPNYNAEFNRSTKKSIEFLGAKRVHPIFVDTAERVKNMMTTSFAVTENMNLLNWHLPFKRLIFIAGGFIMDLTEEDEEFKNVCFTLTTTELGDYCTGEFLIYETDEPPVITINSDYISKCGVRLKNNWKVAVMATAFKDKNGKILPSKHPTTKDKIDIVSRAAVMAVVSYFYPFCVDREMFIVESQVARKKKGKIQTKGKSTYSIMHITKILKRFTPTGQSGQPLTKGHPRRAHIREYRHDRWTKMQGRTIIVKSTWVGPKTVLSEGRLYKVHTDVY